MCHGGLAKTLAAIWRRALSRWKLCRSIGRCLISESGHKFCSSLLPRGELGCTEHLPEQRKTWLEGEKRRTTYLEFILARSFFAFFLAFCLSSPSFLVSVETELSVTMSTMYFFNERCSCSGQNTYLTKCHLQNKSHYCSRKHNIHEATKNTGLQFEKSNDNVLLQDVCGQIKMNWIEFSLHPPLFEKAS